ncbi:sensor histidine kinase [Pseudonocardia humida]|uniref:histidine kinase n=1 Tax=Pseudonocardia humida TaxID=2800819 RepID=A0ABT1A812_9PSEU|nr:sensor histidine kinase [Pseudonocardia humida]MCO1659061.1 sensor domain-containing protein [Pseudonocardia humida]
MLDRMHHRLAAARYLLVALVAAMATTFAPLLLLGATMTVVAGGAGFVLLPRALAALRTWAEWHRRRAGALLGTSVAGRPLPGTGAGPRWRRYTADPDVRRDLRWIVRAVASGLPAGLVTLVCVGDIVFTTLAAPVWWLFPTGTPLRLMLVVPITSWTAALLAPVQVLAVGALGWWAVPRLARWHARTCLAALAPSPQEAMAQRVDALTRSRADAVDSHAAELRRIERDLHDGTQARLVAIAMRLGVAREALAADPGAAATLLDEAHEGTEEAMAELRAVIRTIYPPILADRGLAGAVRALAARAGIPVRLEVDDPGRLPAPVEAAAYFVVSEGLSNASRHGGAAEATVRIARRGATLAVEIHDNGGGGADEARGSGLAGLRGRVAALDGAVTVASPAGGPTTVRAELPCGS